MLEGVMILGTTILLILGTIDICQVFMQMQYMNERARAASRWAAAKWDPTTSTAPVKNYAVFFSPTAPSGRSTGVMGLAPGDVNVSVAGTPGTMSHRVTVSITKPLSLVSPYIARRFTPRAAVATSAMESMGMSGN
jgi:hypothetical protein